MTAVHDDRAEGVDFTYEDGLVTAIDRETGIAASGESRPEALAMLSEALELHAGGGESIEDEDEFFRSIGVDPESFPEEAETPPWQ